MFYAEGWWIREKVDVAQGRKKEMRNRKLVLVTVLGISAGVGILQTKASAASKTVTFGSTGVSYPSSFKSNGKLKGFDVEVVNKASKRLGYKVKWVNADFD